MINIDVAFSPAFDQHLLKKLTLDDHATAKMVVEQLGWDIEFPQIFEYQVGVFSKKIDWDTPLKTGDRLEIYRPLAINPMLRRQKRYKKQRIANGNRKLLNG